MRTVKLGTGEEVVVRDWQLNDVQSMYQTIVGVFREGNSMLGKDVPFHPDQLFQQASVGNNRSHATFVAVIPSGQVIGWIRCDRKGLPYTEHSASLWMGVAEKYRRKGIGKALLREAFEWASATDVERLELGVRGGNKAAVSLYRSMGFQVEGRRPKAIKTPTGYEDDIWMAVTFDKKGQVVNARAKASAKSKIPLKRPKKRF